MPAGDHALARDTITVFDHLQELIDGHRGFLVEHDVLDQVVGVAEGTVADLAPPETLHPAQHEHAMAVMSVSAVHALWERTRNVCAWDPDMAAVIRESRIGRFPADLFERLPLINPLVLYPRPVPVPSSAGNLHLIGFYVVGLLDDERRAAGRKWLCDTHDPDRDGLHLVLLLGGPNGQLAARHGRLIGMGLPITGQTSLTEVVNDSLAALPDATVMDRETLAAAIGEALAGLLYLCTKEPDVRDAQDGRGMKPTALQGKRRACRVLRVGWRLGPVFATARTATRTDTDPAVVDGAAGQRARPKMHPRIGGMQWYWTGPGRSVPEWLFRSPTVVNVGVEASTTTVIPVRGR